MVGYAMGQRQFPFVASAPLVALVTSCRSSSSCRKLEPAVLFLFDIDDCFFLRSAFSSLLLELLLDYELMYFSSEKSNSFRKWKRFCWRVFTNAINLKITIKIKRAFYLETSNISL